MTNTPGLSPEQDDVLQQRLKELEAIEVETPTPSTEGEEQPKPTTAATPQPSTETEAAAPKEEPKEEPKAEKTEPTGEDFTTDNKVYQAAQSIGDPTALPRQLAAKAVGMTGLYDKHPGFLKAMSDPMTPMASGLSDFGVDAFNKITGLKAPKIPKYESEHLQSIREMSSFILPTMLLGQGLTAAGTRAHAGIGMQLGNSALVKFISKLGIDLGSGLLVDEINVLNETDDDPLTVVAKAWPNSWGKVIPRDWTSLDCDSPQCKKIRNRDQGALLGLTLGMFEGIAKYAAGKGGVKKAVGWLPESERGKAALDASRKDGAENIVDAEPLSLEEQARNWYNQTERNKLMAKNISPDQARMWEDLDGESQKKWTDMLEQNKQIFKPSDDPAEQAEALIHKRASEEMDETNAEGIVKQLEKPDGTEPIPGVHDMFEHRELGARTADNMGIVGVAKDQAELMRGKPGRLGSVYSSSALKFSLMVDNPAGRALFKKAKSVLKASRDIAYKAKDHLYTSDEISKQGDELAAKWLDPNMSGEDLRKSLTEYKTNLVDGVEYINDAAYDGVMKAIKGYFDEYLDMDELKAAAYINTSMTGQVSDLAEAARLEEGTAAVRRVQSEIFDRLQILMAEKGVASYIAGRALNMKNRWSRFKSAAKQLAGVQNSEIEMGELIKTKYGDAQKTVDILRDIHRERPEMLGPMMLAYELSDGKIDTVAKLNKVVENQLGGLHKAFFDGNPEMPSELINALYANYYNSILTGLGTPAKAGFGNLVNMAMKPTALALGGVIGLNPKTLKRAWVQYSAFGESLSRGFEHMGKVFGMASNDPSSVGYIMREDIARVNEDKMLMLRSYAEAQSDLGNDGPLSMVMQIEELNDLANNPILRFGANAMTAFDGFTRAMVASSEARIRAYDRLARTTKKVTGEALKAATEAEFKKMFDESGMITDKAVDYSSREIALSLDNPGVDALNDLIKRAPIMKPFLMFPRTQMNAIALFDSSSPMSVFAKEFNEIAYGNINKMGQARMEEILTKRGIDIEGDVLTKFETLRAEIRGRKAIGMLTVAGAGYLFMNDRLRGNGHHKKEVQKTRREANWAPRTYKGWDGNWHSYDGMGIFSDWLALTADVMDNGFSGLTTARTEQLHGKMAFILAASLTNKSYFANLEPMMDVLSGNPAAMARFGATAISGAAPMSAIRRELSQIMYPGLREVDDDLFQLLRNRNGFADSFNPEAALPYRVSWVTGKKVGQPKDFWTRVHNAIMPNKKHDDLDPREQFLIDIEFEHRPIMNKDEFGYEFTNEQQEELYTLIAQDQSWQRALQTAMVRAKDAGFVEKLDKARANNIPSEPGGALFRNDDDFVDKTKFYKLQSNLKAELQAAKKRAIERLSDYPEIRAAMDNQRRLSEMSEQGRLDQLGYY